MLSIYSEVMSGVWVQYKYGSGSSPLPCELAASGELWSLNIGMTVGDFQHLLSCTSSEVGVVDQSVSRKYNVGTSVSIVIKDVG